MQQTPPTQFPVLVVPGTVQGLLFWPASGAQVPPLQIWQVGQLATHVLVAGSQQPLVQAVPVAQQAWPVPPHAPTQAPLEQVWPLVQQTVLAPVPQVVVVLSVQVQAPF